MPEMNIKLRGAIVSKYGTIGKFCEDLGKTRSWLWYKVKRNSFKPAEIKQFCEMLDIKTSDIPKYFF